MLFFSVFFFKVAIHCVEACCFLYIKSKKESILSSGKRFFFFVCSASHVGWGRASEFFCGLTGTFWLAFISCIGAQMCTFEVFFHIPFFFNFELFYILSVHGFSHTFALLSYIVLQWHSSGYMYFLWNFFSCTRFSGLTVINSIRRTGRKIPYLLIVTAKYLQLVVMRWIVVEGMAKGEVRTDWGSEVFCMYLFFLAIVWVS